MVTTEFDGDAGGLCLYDLGSARVGQGIILLKRFSSGSSSASSPHEHPLKDKVLVKGLFNTAVFLQSVSL